jgi:hypothetical protein
MTDKSGDKKKNNTEILYIVSKANKTVLLRLDIR